LLDEFYEQKEVMDAAGISSRTNIIVGYPTENEDDLKQSFDACYNANILPSVCYLLPIPGSEMYDYALKQGYIVDEKKYIMSIGEQQYLKINMSDMSDEFLESVTLYHLKRIRDKLDLDIADDRLICSVKVRSDGELRGCDIQ